MNREKYEQKIEGNLIQRLKLCHVDRVRWQPRTKNAFQYLNTVVVWKSSEMDMLNIPN